MRASFVALSVFMILSAISARAAEPAPLLLEGKISLGDVKGRLDHMAIDVRRNRLFVAETENNSVAVIDLIANKKVRSITALSRPQGLGYVPSTDTLYIANGTDGTVRLFNGDSLSEIERLALGTDADNIRVDLATKSVLVAHGTGALTSIDISTRRTTRELPLKTHPESFQQDELTKQIFINDPVNEAIVVASVPFGAITATWPVGSGGNFPMALDENGRRILVGFRRPATLGAFSMDDGAMVARIELCSDADDMFVNTKTKQLYVTCGEGILDVFDIRETSYPRIARIPTAQGARTSLFVPELERLFVAAPASQKELATIWIFMPNILEDQSLP
jgi:DNA-binding beta-propeller fold protein YncE